MNKMVDIRTKGLKELDRELGSLAMKLQVEGANAMNRSGANVILKAARKNCPVETGNLKASLTVVQIKSAKTGSVVHWVTHKTGKGVKNDGWYAHIVEFGNIHGPYDIPKRGRATKKLMSTWQQARGGVKRGTFGVTRATFGRRIEGKTWRAKPYMRKAFYENDEKAIDKMGENLGNFLERKKMTGDEGGD